MSAPHGKSSSFRPQADQHCAELQREADKVAKRGPRACMCCKAEFYSEGIHNRMCGRCRGFGESDQPQRPAVPARRFA